MNQKINETIGYIRDAVAQGIRDAGADALAGRECPVELCITPDYITGMEGSPVQFDITWAKCEIALRPILGSPMDPMPADVLDYVMFPVTALGARFEIHIERIRETRLLPMWVESPTHPDGFEVIHTMQSRHGESLRFRVERP